MRHIISPTVSFNGISSGSSLYLDFRVSKSELPFLQGKDLRVEVEQPEEQKQSNIYRECINSGCKRHDENGCTVFERGMEPAKWRSGRCSVAPYVLEPNAEQRLNSKQHGNKVLLSYGLCVKTYKRKSKNSRG